MFARNQLCRLDIVFNDDVTGCLDVAAGVNTADDVDGTVHFQSAGNGGDILTHNQHICDKDAPADKLEFSVHLGDVGHAVRRNGESDAAQRLFLGSVLGMDGFAVDVRSGRTFWAG